MRSTYMDEYSGKRAVDGLVSKKGSGLVLRESPNRDRNAQLCSRLGCSGRLNSVKSAQIEKAKPSRPVFRSSSSGKEIIGSSSRSCVGVGNTSKSIAEPCKKLSSNLETDSSETSSVQDDPEVSEIAPPLGKIQRGLHPECQNSVSSEVTLMEIGSSGLASNTRSRRSFNQRSGLCSQDSIVGSNVSTGSKNTIQTRASTARNGLRNLRCNSVSDVVPSSCSSSDSSLGRRETIKKRTSEGESSSAAKGKKMNGSLLAQNPSSSHGISISDSRRGRNMPSNRDNNGVASVRTRRTVTGHSRGRLLTNQGSGTNSSSSGSSAGPHTSEPEMSINTNASSSSQQSSAEVPLIRLNSYSRPGSSSGTLHRILRAGASDVGFSRSLRNQDGLRCYNMDGIAEVLLALERIEHNEELTFEQLLVLETNLFLNGLNFYDQHRDMRLDIDNMTYEELLALEERMGTVSTALPEEALSNCLKKSIYQFMPQEDASVSWDGKKADVKCSICQEEYVAGDEVGRLRCEHRFHVVCVNQWLRLKNWCPICKGAAAAPAPSPSPSPPST